MVGRECKALIRLYGYVKRDVSYDQLTAAANQQETRLERAVQIKHR